MRHCFYQSYAAALLAIAVCGSAPSLLGCSEAECIAGSEGCECNGGLCLTGLQCLSSLCVDPNSGTAGTGGTGGVGGVAEACGSPSSAFAMCGTITEGTVPDGSRVLALWVGTEQAYKLGEGTTSGDKYVVEFPTAPPVEALLNEALGVAFIMIVPASLGSIADGGLDREAANVITDNLIGVGRLNAIIYRTSASVVDWDQAFSPNAYGCGACVIIEGRSHEFEPIDCEEGLDVVGLPTPDDARELICDID